MEPVYPKDNGSLERAKEAFRKKVANWNWEEYDENKYQGKRRGRKPKIKEKPKAQPRTKSEQQALNNKFFNYDKIH